MMAGPTLAGIQRIVAVVGCQRSGTTLTGQLLGAHPEAILLDEWDGLYPWFHAQAAGPAESLAQAMLHAAAAKYADPGSRVQVRDGRAALAPGITTLVLKAPNLTYDDGKLAQLPVPVAVLHPVRDPRGVVASMARLDGIDFVGNQMRLMQQRPATAAEYAAELRVIADPDQPVWVRRAVVWRVKSGRAAAFAGHGIPTCQFRYEDLTAGPEAVVADLLRTCGLPSSSAALCAHESYRGRGPGGTDRTRAVDSASLRAWDGVLDAAQQADVLRAAGPLAAEFGYG